MKVSGFVEHKKAIRDICRWFPTLNEVISYERYLFVINIHIKEGIAAK